MTSLSRGPSSPGGGLQSRKGWCNSSTGFQFNRRQTVECRIDPRAKRRLVFAFCKEQTPHPQNAGAACECFLDDILNKTIVLVLNRNWHASNVRTPQEAFCRMATNVATALEIA